MAFSFGTKLTFKTVVLVAGMFTLAMLLMGKGHAFADCAITGGTDHDYAGAVIQTEYWDYGTNTWVPAYGSNMRVKVTTDAPLDSPPGNVVQVTAAQIAAQQNQVQQRQYSESFKVLTGLPSAGNCPNNGVAAVITGDGSSGSPADDGGSNWALDCDISKHPTFYQSFTVTGTGTPNGATPGGTWTTVTMAPHNGYSATKVIQYTPPERPPKGNFEKVSCTILDVNAWDPDDGRHGDGSGGQAVYVRIVWGATTILGPVVADAGPMTGVYNDGYTDYAGWGSSNWGTWINLHPSSVTLTEQAKDLETGAWSTVDTYSFNGATCQGPPLITVTGACTTLALTGSAWDTDQFANNGPAFLTVSISYEGGFVANVVANQLESNGHTHGYSQNVASLYPGGVGDHTFTLVAKGVNGSGVPDGNNTTISFHLACAPTGGGGCPSMPSSQVTVSLPDQAPNTPAQSGATNTPNQQYEQDTPQKKTNETAINDTSPSQWGGQAVLPTVVSQAYQTITLDYTPYINGYPYDNNQPSVTYDSYYNKTNWYTSSSPDYYTCPSGGSVSGSNCTYGAYSYYTCPSGGFASGSTCYVYVGSATYNATTNTYTCSSGSYVFGACYTSYSATLVYYCSPGSLSGTTCTYGATAWYNWHQGATTNNATRSNTVNGQLMTPCWNRTFQVNSVSGDQTNLNDNENPTTVTGGGGTISVTFGYSNTAPTLGLRQRMQVNLGYNTQYTINGVTPYMVGCSGTSGGVSIIGGFSSGPGSGTVPNSTCSATVPPLQAGDQICGSYNVTPTGTQMDRNGTITANNGVTATDTVCSGRVVNEPYARFYGNDVSAGGAFATGNNQCAGSSMNPGTISTYQRGGGARPMGSGSQFAALSLGAIQGFASAFLRSAAPTSPLGLSFANTTGGFGGNLNQGNGNYQHCVPDYYATLPAQNSAWAGSFATSGAYTVNGDLILGPGALLDGTNISIYVTGNVYITGPLTFQTTGWRVTGNSSNVPSLYIIAKGSINISPLVNTLYGVYVAQNNTIHTCAGGLGTANLYTGSQLYANCHTTLRVNGSFIATNVVLDRTYSSLRHSVSGENPYGGGLHPCDVSGGVLIDPKIDCSAEIFSSGLDTYLASPELAPTGGLKTGKYDAITSLSPVL